MKIAGLKTFVVGNPPPAFGGRYFGFLKLKTSHAYSDSPFYSNPDAAAERAAVKFDPPRPYSTFDPRQPTLERSSSASHL